MGLSIMVGSPKTSGPVYQSTQADLHRRRSFGFAGFLRSTDLYPSRREASPRRTGECPSRREATSQFPVLALTQGRSDLGAFTQGLAGQASW